MSENESEKSDLRLLYQISVDDIAFFKQQQWRVTNYAVISYVAVVAAASIARNAEHFLDVFEKPVMGALVVAVVFGAIYAIRSLGRSLQGARDCVDEIRPHLSPAFRECYEVKWAKMDRSKRDLPFPYLFYGYVLIGAVIVGWVLYAWF